MKLREADVFRLPMADPGDVSALAALLGARTFLPSFLDRHYPAVTGPDACGAQLFTVVESRR